MDRWASLPDVASAHSYFFRAIRGSKFFSASSVPTTGDAFQAGATSRPSRTDQQMPVGPAAPANRGTAQRSVPTLRG